MTTTGAPFHRIRSRSMPPPPSFDPATLGDNMLLTPKELAGWLRLSRSTLEDWRLHHPDRGPPWVLVAGKPRYRLGDIRRWLLADAPTNDRHSAGVAIEA